MRAPSMAARKGEVQESLPYLREAINGGLILVSADALVNVSFLYAHSCVRVLKVDSMFFLPLSSSILM